MRFAITALVCLSAWLGSLSAAEVGWIEDYVLADDRQAALEELVPGSDEYWYYHCLTLQHEGRLDEAAAMLARWRQRVGDGNTLADRIELRQAALRAERDPAAAVAVLRRELAPELQREPPPAVEKRFGSSRLDAELLTWSAIRERGLRQYRHLEGFSAAGLVALFRDGHRGELRRLLSRLPRADLDGLVPAIARDLQARDSAGFGSLPVHGLLDRAQLIELERLRPDLRDHPQYLSARLRTLLPAESARLRYDRRARRAWLESVWAYVAELPPSTASLQKKVLTALLQEDLAAGRPDRGRFISWLQLPRGDAWVPRRLRRQYRERSLALDGSVLPLPPDAGPVGAELLDAYLQYFLHEAADPSAFAGMVAADRLQRAFVTAKVLAGIGDPADWLARVDDAAFARALRERVELTFAATNPRLWAPEEAVSLAIDVKNVDSLLVRVFAIDTVAYHREQTGELQPGIELGGLVANASWDLAFEQSPLERHRQRIDLPQAVGRGAWVVELIGNGRATRALIRKGDLVADEEITAQGHRFTIRDESGRRRPEAQLWLAGRLFDADDEGRVLVPFSSEPGSRRAVLQLDGFARPLQWQHQGEAITLDVALVADHESLIPGEEADLLIQPRLRISGRAVSLDRLQDVRLTISGVDAEGVTRESVLADPAFEPGRDYVHRFRVPEDLIGLSLRLQAWMPSQITGERVELVAEDRMELGKGHDTLHQAHFFREVGPSGTALRCLGRNGEAIAGLHCRVIVRHRYLKQPISVQLVTDADGRIQLGSFPLVESVQVFAALSPGLPGSLAAIPWLEWHVRQPTSWRSRSVHRLAGQPFQLPVIGDQPPDVSCHALRNGAVAIDVSDRFAIVDGRLACAGLDVGRYQLQDHTNDVGWTIDIVAGRRDEGWLIGGHRRLEVSPEAPVHIDQLQVVDDQLRLHVAGWRHSTRVHLLPYRFSPPWQAIRLLNQPPSPRAGHNEPLLADYLGLRRIGDEERYILERQQQGARLGVMLAKPSLLVQPWEVGGTSFDEFNIDGGGRFAARMGGGRRQALGRYGGIAGIAIDDGSPLAPFLAEALPGRYNVTVDEQGWLELPVAELAGARGVLAVAVHDFGGSARVLPLTDQEPARRDLRLAQALDPAEPHARQPLRRVLDAGETVTIPDIGHARFRAYSALGQVAETLFALQPAAQNGLEALLRWPELSEAERLRLLDEHGCHEMHLFLYHKDRAWFDRVVRPAVAQKRRPDLIDRYLLGEDLAGYGQAAEWQRLNIVERILVAQRQPQYRAALQQAIADRLAVQEPDPALADRRFRTALASRGMSDAVDALEEAKRAPPSAPPPASEARLMRKESTTVADAAPPAPMEAEELADAEPQAFGSTVGETLMPNELALDATGAADGGPVRQLYRVLEPTRIWAESRYHRIRWGEQDAELVEPDAFWQDFAAAAPGSGFRSAYFPAASDSATEVWLALALTDLPFEAAEPTLVFDGRQMTATATGPTIALASDLRPAAPAEATRLLVTQALFDAVEPERRERGRMVLNRPAELIAGRPYGQRIVLTNPTDERLQIELLLQIPAGSLPLGGSRRTEVRSLVLQPYATLQQQLFFYWPAAGVWRQHPATVAQDGVVFGRGAVEELTVRQRPSGVDTGSWAHVAAYGELDDVLAYLRTANLADIDLDRCGWRLADPEAYNAIAEALDQRLVVAPSVLVFAIVHHDLPRLAQWIRLQRSDRFGPALEAGWLRLDPWRQRRYDHLEFAPLVNPRAHRISQRPQIENVDLHQHYVEYLQILAHRPALDDEARIGLASYLLAQDRIEAARQLVTAVDPAAVHEKMQFDYLQCYLALAAGDPATAGDIAGRYAEAELLPRWRHRFAQVRAQLAELAGEAVGPVDASDRQEQLDATAAASPALELARVDQGLRLRTRNVGTVALRYFRMDVESLFSRNPFLGVDEHQQAAVVQPHRVDEIAVDPSGTTTVAVPGELQQANLLVEAEAAGLRRRLTHLANSLQVTLLAEAGQVQVRDRAGAPVAAAYVKVYRRNPDGLVEFHKDGYTDLRGRFDYASLSGNYLGRLERFALLVISKEHGAVIEEVAPPAR